MYILYNPVTRQFVFEEFEENYTNVLKRRGFYFCIDDDTQFNISVFACHKDGTNQGHVEFNDDPALYISEMNKYVEENLTDVEPAVVTVTEFSLPECESIVCTKTIVRGIGNGGADDPRHGFPVELEFCWYEFNMLTQVLK